MKKFDFLKTFLLFIYFYPSIHTAQLSITSTNVNFNIDFDTNVIGVNDENYTGSGINPNPLPGQLDGNAWNITGFSDNHNFDEISETGDMARGIKTDAVGTGGLYSFETSPNNYAIGVQPGTSDFTPGAITLKVTNNTEETITNLSLNYKVYIYNDQNRSNSFNFSYSSDDITYIPINELDLISNADSDTSNSWIQNDKSTTITTLNIPIGDNFYLKWTGDDIGGTGSRDQFALDDISINMNSDSNSTLSNESINNNSKNIAIYRSSNNEVTVTGLSNFGQLIIHSLLGEKIMTKNLQSNEINKIPLPPLSNGIYIFHVNSKFGIRTKKIIFN